MRIILVWVITIFSFVFLPSLAFLLAKKVIPYVKKFDTKKVFKAIVFTQLALVLFLLSIPSVLYVTGEITNFSDLVTVWLGWGEMAMGFFAASMYNLQFAGFAAVMLIPYGLALTFSLLLIMVVAQLKATKKDSFLLSVIICGAYYICLSLLLLGVAGLNSLIA
jgi:hypothetical protein